MLGSRYPAASLPVPPRSGPFRTLLRHTCNMAGAAHLPPLETDIPGCVARRSCGRPERAARSRCRVPVPEAAAAGASTLTTARAQPGRYRRGQSRRERPGYPAPLQSRASGPSPGTHCERAPTGTASSLGAIHRTEQPLPCSSPPPTDPQQPPPLKPSGASQVRVSPSRRPGEAGVQARAGRAPCPSRGCALRWCSPWPELRLLHPGPLPLPSRAVVAVGARCHTPGGPARTR
jgi:hypothetical protein